LISPQVDSFFWYDFDKGDDLIRAGEEATYSKIGEIRKKISPKRDGFLRRLLLRFVESGSMQKNNP
jgi:hypothetical protein